MIPLLVAGAVSLTSDVIDAWKAHAANTATAQAAKGADFQKTMKAAATEASAAAEHQQQLAIPGEVQSVTRQLLESPDVRSMARLMADYAVEGVLFTDLTHYSPYRPISIGVRCKLIDARSGVQRWVFDHFFDSGNPDIAVAAKRFAAGQEIEQLPIPTDGASILQSPSQFGKYVAHETYRSLLGI